VGGFNYACVLLENGQVFCRGYSVRGQLGILEGATEEERNNSRLHKYSRFTRVKTLGDDTRVIAAGLAHSCALKRDGSVWCWGQNDYGQIGKGDISICEPAQGLLLSCTPEEGLEPSRVDGLPDGIVDLRLGYRTSCAIDGQGSVWCWGYVDEPTPRPLRLNVGAPVTAVTIGERWCALMRDGRVRCQTDRRAMSWSKARTMSLGCP
jgi:alpha-tubulin suppressor-like RCC1 family protein